MFQQCQSNGSIRIPKIVHDFITLYSILNSCQSHLHPYQSTEIALIGVTNILLVFKSKQKQHIIFKLSVRFKNSNPLFFEILSFLDIYKTFSSLFSYFNNGFFLPRFSSYSTIYSFLEGHRQTFFFSFPLSTLIMPPSLLLLFPQLQACIFLISIIL